MDIKTILPNISVKGHGDGIVIYNYLKVYNVLIIDNNYDPYIIRAITEDIIGPYELHDFFLYHFIRWGSTPRKILWLATHAFKNYDEETINKWLKVFITRFFRNQWKRSVMPDGPKVGSIALSPRGDWRMPSDAELTVWLKDLD